MGFGPWGFKSLRPHHSFGPTNESSRATLVLSETEMFLWLDLVQRTPAESQAEQKRPWISVERFVKKYLG